MVFMLPRPAAAAQELTIEAPFAGFSVPDVALFLRLLYDSRWQSAAAATFEQLGDSLPAMLRLAHQLEARQLLSALCSYMAGGLHSGVLVLCDGVAQRTCGGQLGLFYTC